MALAPDYGSTPVSDDELSMLLPQARVLLGAPVDKAALFDLEQEIQLQVTEELVPQVVGGAFSLDDLLDDYFLRDLHGRLYGDIWVWAGKLRSREVSIGIAPEHIAVTLRSSLDTIRYRWQHTTDWTPHSLGIATHAETVRIHPFIDGNGRTTRLLADLVFLAAQDDETLSLYDWDLDKVAYVRLLQQYDRHRDPKDLADFIATTPV